jgi:adenine-specific DNA-methyltransferase
LRANNTGSLVEEVEKDETNEDDENIDGRTTENFGLDWQTFRRRDLASRRGTKKGGPRQFYPFYVNVEHGHIEAVGDPLPHVVSRDSAPQREGCVAVFPIRSDGTEMNWSAIGPTFEKRWKEGHARAGKPTPDQPQRYIIQYLKKDRSRISRKDERS